MCTVVNTQGEYYGSLLQAASAGGYDGIVRMLLDGDVISNAQGGEYSSALQRASYSCHDKIMQMLLDTGAEVNAVKGNDRGALQAASYKGFDKTVRTLLNRGADVNAQGGHYDSAIQAALARRHGKVQQTLLGRGANVKAQGRLYDNALQAASERHHDKVVQMSLDAGVDVNAEGRHDGKTLHAASVRGRDEAVQLLLDRAADITTAINNRLTPLHAAANNGRLEVVYLLIDAVANSNAQNRWKRFHEHDSNSGRIRPLEEMVMQLSILDFPRYPLSTDKGSWYSERLLGQGSQAVVDAVRNDDGLRIARKTILRSHLAHRSFLNEIRALGAMRHPHITRLLGTSLFDLGYTIYLYPVADTDLRWLMSQPIDSGTENALAQTACLVSALAQAHGKGFVHNDIKPANILIKRSTSYHEYGKIRAPDILDDRSASQFHVILADFGLSRRLPDTSSLPQAYGRVTGTPMYTAPECTSSPSSDIWSLGCVFTEILTWHFHRPLHAVDEYLQHQPYHANPGLIRTWLTTLDPADDAEAVTMIALTQEMLSPRSEDRPTAKELASKLPWKCTCKDTSLGTFGMYPVLILCGTLRTLLILHS